MPTRSAQINFSGVKNDTTSHQIATYFSQFGRVKFVELHDDASSENNLAKGLVMFEAASSVQKALWARNPTVNNCRFTIELPETDVDRSARQATLEFVFYH